MTRMLTVTFAVVILCSITVFIAFSTEQSSNSLSIHGIVRWPGIQLGQISCSSAGRCLAVGSRTANGGSEANVEAVRRSSAGWSRPYQLGLRVRGSGDGQISVACGNDNSCMVYGALGQLPYPLIGVTSRRKPDFRQYHDPKLIVPTDLVKHLVSCSVYGDCWSIVQKTGSGLAYAAVGYVDGEWQTPFRLGAPLINPKSSAVANVFISDIECNSLDICAVIGRAAQGSTDSEFIQVESNGHWQSAIEVPAVVIRGHYWRFDIVHSYAHCIDYGDCIIAAAVTNGNESRGVIVQELHGHWTGDVQLIPTNLVHSNSFISNYTCHLESLCVVAGVAESGLNESTVYAEIQKGEHWSSPFTARSVVRFAVDGVAVSQPLAADCPNADSCVVVGVFKQASGQNSSFIARYRDHRWESAILNVGGPDDVTQITGLSCSSATCWAVGTVFNSEYVPLDGVVIPISV